MDRKAFGGGKPPAQERERTGKEDLGGGKPPARKDGFGGPFGGGSPARMRHKCAETLYLDGPWGWIPGPDIDERIESALSGGGRPPNF